MKDNRLFYGNSAIQPDLNGDGRERGAIPHPLVEECISLSLADLRRLFGRKELLKAAEDARPVHVRIHGNAFSIYLLQEPHRLPSRHGRVFYREITRLWIVCMCCRRRVRKLYTYEKIPGSNILYMALCRSCHGLVYQSQNCGGNRWWREIARPLKKMIRRRERLLERKQSGEVMAQLEQVNQLIWIMRQRAKPKSSPGREIPQSAGAKRRYRNLGLILQSLPC